MNVSCNSWLALSGDVTNHQPIMSKNGQTETDSEFALPARMRHLASRILQELIDPCRARVLSAEEERDKSINQAQKKLNEIEEKSNSMIEKLQGLRSDATSHLESVGEKIPHPPHPESSATGEDLTQRIDLGKLNADFKSYKVSIEKFCQQKFPPYWPKNSGARCAILISTAILVFVYPPLVLYWPVLIFSVRLYRSKFIQNEYKRLAGQNEEFCRIWKSVATKALESADAEIESATKLFREELNRIGDHYPTVSDQLHADEAQLWKDSGSSAMEWSSPGWNDWEPDPSPGFAGRIGKLVIEPNDLKERLPSIDFDFELPALIPFNEERCLLLEGAGETKEMGARALQSALIRALANTPPGKALFTLIDPVGLGQNVADFMHLGDYDPQLINGKPWSDPQHIEERLAKLMEDMEVIIQTYLRNIYGSLNDYNHEHQEVSEPFRFLVIFDFPVNFTETACRRLANIIKNGPRCGVHTLIVCDTATKFPQGVDVKELRRNAVVVTPGSEGERSRLLSVIKAWNKRRKKNR